MHIEIIYDTVRQLDPTIWLDYVGLAEFIVFTVFLLGASLGTVAMARQSRIDIYIKGPVWLNIMFLGAWLHVASTFVSDKHLDALDPLRLLHCTLWDYWGTLFGFCLCYVFYASSLISTVIKSMIYIDPNFVNKDDPMYDSVQARMMDSIEQKLAPGPTIHEGIPPPMPGNDGLYEIDIGAAHQELDYTVFSPENSDGWDIQDDKMEGITRAYMEDPIDSRADPLDSPPGLVGKIRGWTKRLFRKRDKESSIPGEEVVVESEDEQCIEEDDGPKDYSETAGTMRVISQEEASNYTAEHGRGVERRPSRVVRTERVTIEEASLAMEMLQDDSYSLHGMGIVPEESGMSDTMRAFRRWIGYGWNSLSMRWKFKMLRLVCLITLLGTAFVLCLLPEVTKGWLVSYSEVEGACITVWYYKTVVIGMLGVFLVVLWFFYSNLKYGRRIPFFNIQQYFRSLAAMTVVLSALIVFNLLAIETFAWGRFLYLSLIILLYVYLVIQMIGSSFLDMLRGRRVVDDEICMHLHNKTLPRTFRDLVSNSYYRRAVLPEFLAWVRRMEGRMYLIPATVKLGRGGRYERINCETNVDYIDSLSSNISGQIWEETQILEFVNDRGVLFPDRVVDLYSVLVTRRRQIADYALAPLGGNHTDTNRPNKRFADEIDLNMDHFKICADYFPKPMETGSLHGTHNRMGIFKDFRTVLANVKGSFRELYDQRGNIPALPYTSDWRFRLEQKATGFPSNPDIYLDAENFIESIFEMVFWSDFYRDPECMKSLKRSIQVDREILTTSGVVSSTKDGLDDYSTDVIGSSGGYESHRGSIIREMCCGCFTRFPCCKNWRYRPHTGHSPYSADNLDEAHLNGKHRRVDTPPFEAIIGLESDEPEGEERPKPMHTRANIQEATLNPFVEGGD